MDMLYKTLKYKLLIFLSLVCCALKSQECKYEVDPAHIVGKINKNIYGQFLEHICNSIHGGLWGDMILNGTMEMKKGYGGWHVESNSLLQHRRGNFDRIVFGDNSWTDYIFELEVLALEGDESVVASVRNNINQFYDVNFFGYNQTEFLLEKNVGGVYNEHLLKVNRSANKKVWNKIKIVCDGNEITAFLNDKLQFKYKDTLNPILKGAVGFTTYNSKVQIRNIRVSTLKGEILFSGMPALKELSCAPMYWDIMPGSVIMADDLNPFNSTYSQKIVSMSENHVSGLCQRGLFLKKNEIYKGSFFYKKDKDSNAKLLLEILDNDNCVMFSQDFDDVSEGWQCKNFQFTSAKTIDNAIVRFSVKGKGYINIDQLSLMSLSSIKNGGFRVDMLNALKDLHPATIRYPGGCYASQYNWRDGIGPHEKRVIHPYEIWEDRDVNQFGTDEFLSLCDKVNAEPIFVVNINKGIKNTIEWIDYIQLKRNADIQYIEIDNETWHMGPEAYADSVIIYSKAIKGKFPNIKIIACGPYAYDTGEGQAGYANWTQRLLDKAADYIDFISPHYYNGLLNALDYKVDPLLYECFIKKLGNQIRNSRNPDIKVYVSEWNPMTTDWRTGMYAASILNVFERQSDIVEMSCPALLFRRTWAKMWDNALINHDNGKLFFSPNYIVMKLWRDNYAPFLLNSIESYKDLNVVITCSEDKKIIYLKYVNTSNTSKNLSILLKNISKICGAQCYNVAPKSENTRNTLDLPNNIFVEYREPEVDDNTISLPIAPLSVGVIIAKIDVGNK